MKTIQVAVALCLCLGMGPAFARKVKGVDMPDTATVEGQTLNLKGMGVRKKFVFDVYVAGLYVQKPDAEVLSNQAKQMKLVMLRDLSAEKVGDAIREGFEKNSSADLPKLKERLDKLVNSLTGVKKGESLTVTFVPGKGTMVATEGKLLSAIEGDDFGEAVFKVWLGAKPVDDDLKKHLVGRGEA